MGWMLIDFLKFRCMVTGTDCEESNMNIFLKILTRLANPFYCFNRVYSLFFALRFNHCGSGFRAIYPLVVKGEKFIKIGENCSLSGTNYLFANDGGYLSIGDNCSINTNVQLGASGGRIVIGDNVLIAPNVVIRAADHGIARDRQIRFQPHTYGEIIIEDDCWICSNAVITSNVTLAKGTVVGAGAVVTKSTEPYSIVAGVPATKIQERV